MDDGFLAYCGAFGALCAKRYGSRLPAASSKAGWKNAAVLPRNVAITALLFAGLANPGQAANYVYHQIIAENSQPDPDPRYNPDGLSPGGELIEGPDGKFYGAAAFGGINASGTIFYIADDASAGLSARPVPVYSFSATSGANPSALQINADGAQPGGLSFGKDGLIYGTTLSGGANGTGTIFKISLDGSLTTLHTFSAPGSAGLNADGCGPVGTLVQASDGSFYGMTQGCGAGGSGTIYKLEADGSFTTLYSFAPLDINGGNAGSLGGWPSAGLTLGNDGNLYGTTQAGGSQSNGLIFRITPGGKFTILHQFVIDSTSTSDGGQPNGPLLLASDGSFYGTTRIGGSSGYGTVFRISADGSYAVLHRFGSIGDSPPVTEGSAPHGSLIELPDGNLMGVTDGGFGISGGTIFELSKSGTYRLAHDFMDIDELGVGPSGGLVIGRNGMLYGITAGMTGANLYLGMTGTFYRLRLTNSPSATLSLSPDRVQLGLDNAYTVTWNAPGADRCDFGTNVVPQAASGSISAGSLYASALYPIVYELICYAPFGDTTADAVESLYLGAPVVNISLSSTSIKIGDTTTVTWSSATADSCVGTGAWSGDRGMAGSIEDSKTGAGSYDYTLTCTNSAGSTSVTATLTVSAATSSNSSPPAGSGGGGGAVDRLFLSLLLTLMIFRSAGGNLPNCWQTIVYQICRGLKSLCSISVPRSRTIQVHQFRNHMTYVSP